MSLNLKNSYAVFNPLQVVAYSRSRSTLLHHEAHNPLSHAKTDESARLLPAHCRVSRPPVVLCTLCTRRALFVLDLAGSVISHLAGTYPFISVRHTKCTNSRLGGLARTHEIDPPNGDSKLSTNKRSKRDRSQSRDHKNSEAPLFCFFLFSHDPPTVLIVFCQTFYPRMCTSFHHTR